MELLDDFSQLNQQFHPKASEQLEPFTTVEEVFLWTGKPNNLWMDFHPKKLSKEQRTAILYCLGLFLLALLHLSQYELELVLLVAFAGIAFIGATFLIILLTELYRRQRTFYGITAKELWVRGPNKHLLKYHIPSLELLTMYNNSICYSSSNNGSFKRHYIFKNIPQIKQVFDLVWQVNQKNIS